MWANPRAGNISGHLRLARYGDGGAGCNNSSAQRGEEVEPYREYIWRGYVFPISLLVFCAGLIASLLIAAGWWGDVRQGGEKCGLADTKVLGWMTQIKDEYRNPVLHPEEVIDPDDALEFMNACISLMASISRALAKAGVTP